MLFCVLMCCSGNQKKDKNPIQICDYQQIDSFRNSQEKDNNLNGSIKKEDIDLSFIKNGKLQYNVTKFGSLGFSTIWRISLYNINEEQEKIIRNITSEKWIKLLNDTISDFAANIILYSIYERNFYFHFDNDIDDDIELWRHYLKCIELKYWEELFMILPNSNSEEEWRKYMNIKEKEIMYEYYDSPCP